MWNRQLGRPAAEARPKVMVEYDVKHANWETGTEVNTVSGIIESDDPKVVKEGVRARLTAAGLRPTWQRLQIGQWVFSNDEKHFTPEDLFRVMQTKTGRGERPVSLATIYNTLNAFVDARLLSMATVKSGKRYFDTNTAPHYHIDDFEGEGLIDVPLDFIEIKRIPELPEGTEIDEIIITIRTRKVRS